MQAREIASAIFARAGVTDMYREGVGYLAIRLLGDDCLEYGPEGQRPHAQLLQRPWRILIRPGLDQRRATMAVAMAVAEWWTHVQTPAPEGVDLDAVALELVVPRAALIEAVARLGYGRDELAAEFVCPTWTIEERLRLLGGPRPRSGARWRLGVAS